MATSKISIRPADLSADRNGILAVLGGNLPGAGEPGRFDWLYLANPDGQARVFVAERGDGRIVGTSAGCPRRVRIEGKIVLGLTLSDFAFDAAYRTLGPALKLLKATLQPVRDGAYALSIDFPSETMRAIYRRAGGVDLGEVHRWVRPLRVDDTIRRRLGDGALSKVAGAAANAALSARDSVARTDSGIEVAEWTEPFDARFDELDRNLGQLRTAVGVRDAAYLEWKYRQHAMWGHRTLVAEAGNELVGYGVFRMTEPGTLQIVDLFAGEHRVRRSLIAGVVRLARIQRASRIAIEALDESRIAAMLGGLGFVRREAGVGPVPTLAPDCPARDQLEDSSEWWLNGGDRDI